MLIPNCSGERVNALLVPLIAAHHFNWFCSQKNLSVFVMDPNFIIHKLWKVITDSIWRQCTCLIKLLQGWNTRIHIIHGISLCMGLYLLNYGHWSLGKEILFPRACGDDMSHGIPFPPHCHHCSWHFQGPWKVVIWPLCFPSSWHLPPAPITSFQFHLSIFLYLLITQNGNCWNHKSAHFILHPPLHDLLLLSSSNH